MEMCVFVRPGRRARIDDDRRPCVLDDGRAADLPSHGQRVAVEMRCVDREATVKPALADRYGLVAAGSTLGGSRQSFLLRWSRNRDAQGIDLPDLVGGEAVEPFVDR